MTTSVLGKTRNPKEQLLNGKKNKRNLQNFKGLRNKHPKNVFLGHLNVNSLRNKFESLNELIKDIFLWSESKLDSSSSDSQFLVPGYRIVKKGQNKNGGVLKSLKRNNYQKKLEIILLEIKLVKMKILVMELYKPLSFSEKDFLFLFE